MNKSCNRNNMNQCRDLTFIRSDQHDYFSHYTRVVWANNIFHPTRLYKSSKQKHVRSLLYHTYMRNDCTVLLLTIGRTSQSRQRGGVVLILRGYAIQNLIPHTTLLWVLDDWETNWFTNRNRTCTAMTRVQKNDRWAVKWKIGREK